MSYTLRKSIVWICFTLITIQGFSQFIDRIQGSPFPASRKPDTLYTIDDTRLSPGQQFVVQSLQGLLSIYRPKIYRISDEGSLMWLSELHRYGIYMNHTLEDDYVGLVKHFRDSINGYILCSMGEGSANAAISLSSIYNAIAVPDSLENDFSSFLPKVLDARAMNEEDVYAKYHDSLSKNVLIYQKGANANCLGDYAIFANAFSFYEPPNAQFSQAVMKDMNTNAALLGWGDNENELVTSASKNNMMVYAADSANNLSALTNVDAPNFDQQESPGGPDTLNPKVHTVCFLMTDGDNIQWFLHAFATSKNWYNADDRGSFPLGWTISPALSELAPPIMRYLYENAGNGTAGRDYFVAGPSGLGYVYPDAFPQLNSNMDLMNKFLKKADLRIVNVIGNARNPDLSPYTLCSNVDAVFYYQYADYAAWKGKIIWSGDKPIIGARYAMWGEKISPQAIAEKLNGEVKNQFQPEGYSLVPVHVWSHNVEDVRKCIGMLNSDVRVVTPDDFVRLIKRNLGISLNQNYPNPFADKTTISFWVNYQQHVVVQIMDGSGVFIKTVFDGDADPGLTKVEFVRDEGMLNGPYICKMTTASQTKSVEIDTY